MLETRNPKNKVTISGEFISEFELDHEVYGEKFYSAKLQSRRKSGTDDILRVIISDRLIDVKESWLNKRVCITGEFRSYNKHEENRNRLILFVFVQDIELDYLDYDINDIQLEGYICKQPNYRTTPLQRQITDVLIAVNRAYGKSDYIPCIFWGRSAKCIGNMNVGDNIKLSGRIQSRVYTKSLGNGELVEHTAYEVSASKFSVVEEEV